MPARLRAAGVAAALVTPLVVSAAPALADSSQPDLLAPVVAAPSLTVLQHTGRTAPGYLFTGPKVEGTAPSGSVVGPLISDDQGRPVWFDQVSDPTLSPTDVRVQRYDGRPVLTYWLGTSLSGPGHGDGTDYVLNDHYKVIAKVDAGDGLTADQHEFRLTPRGTALITSYHQTTVDASSVGGPTDQAVLDCDVQEIDVRTGKVLLNWDALKHVPLRDSHEPLPDSASTPWDWFHVNAVRPDTDGNLIVSARHTWTVYKIARRSGKIIWELGGKQSTFRLGRGVQFAWQHDPDPEGDDTYRIFDNGSDGTHVLHAQTRIVTVHVNTHTDRARLVSVVTHPQHLSATSQGNSQLLPDGHLLVEWGALGRVSEFTAAGKLIYDATVPTGYDTYRGYRYRWVGRPTTKPAVTARANGTDTQLDLVWNGATQVRTWQVYGATSADGPFTPLRSVPWDGLDTQALVAGAPAYVKAVALSGSGHVLGTSPVVSTD